MNFVGVFEHSILFHEASFLTQVFVVGSYFFVLVFFFIFNFFHW